MLLSIATSFQYSWAVAVNNTSDLSTGLSLHHSKLPRKVEPGKYTTDLYASDNILSNINYCQYYSDHTQRDTV